MSCNICIYWTKENGCNHVHPATFERKACVTDFEDDENTFFVQDFKGDFVKSKYLGINHLGMYCFEAIETKYIHGASDFRNVWLVTDLKRQLT